MSTKESKNLYFLKLIQSAYESNNKQSSFEKVFDEIKSKITDPEYEIAYINFQHFIQTVESKLMNKNDLKESIKYSYFYDLMIDILSDNFIGTEKEKQEILDFCYKDPEFKKIHSDISNFKTVGLLSIEVLKNDKLLGSQQCSINSKPLIVFNVTPGEYTIQLSNGRLLWNKKLVAKDIMWKQAFPDKEFLAAAMTEPTKSLISITELLLNGEVSLDIFPGIESGIIKLTLKKK